MRGVGGRIKGNICVVERMCYGGCEGEQWWWVIATEDGDVGCRMRRTTALNVTRTKCCRGCAFNHMHRKIVIGGLSVWQVLARTLAINTFRSECLDAI